VTPEEFCVVLREVCANEVILNFVLKGEEKVKEEAGQQAGENRDSIFIEERGAAVGEEILQVSSFFILAFNTHKW